MSPGRIEPAPLFLVWWFRHSCCECRGVFDWDHVIEPGLMLLPVRPQERRSPAMSAAEVSARDV